MSRRPTRLMPPTGGLPPEIRLQQQHFSRRLHTAMITKGWSQSDLAREIWGSMVDPRGRTVARNRDRISQYLRGRSYPEPQTLERLATALGVPRDELAPDITAATVERENPEVSLVSVAGHPDKTFLQVSKLVPMSVALRVLQVLTDADTPSAHSRNAG